MGGDGSPWWRSDDSGEEFVAFPMTVVLPRLGER
jgi:hypothetical protein